jgi:hypothetical protein
VCPSSSKLPFIRSKGSSVESNVFVPLAFIDADHAAGVAGDAIVGEEVGRVGEDEVDAGFGDGGEDVEAVALEDFDVVLGVVEDGGGEGGARSFGFDWWRGEMRRGFGHGFGAVDDQVGSLIEW